MSEKNEKNVQHSLGEPKGRRVERILSADDGGRFDALRVRTQHHFRCSTTRWRCAAAPKLRRGREERLMSTRWRLRGDCGWRG